MNNRVLTISNRGTGLLALILLVSLGFLVVQRSFSLPLASLPDEQSLPTAPSAPNSINLKDIPYKILYESYSRTQGVRNWELFIMNADGSNKINLTQTPRLHEMYPHASPDGTQICFVIDEGTTRRNMNRGVYYMNIDGTNRVLVARNGREPCWSPDGKSIAYLEGEYDTYTTREYATSELMIYDLQTGQSKPHPNKNLHHIYAICWAPNGKWILGVTQGNTIYSDAILALEADGTQVIDLARWGVKGCRPDLRFDGKKITWGEDDWHLCIGDIDFSQEIPKVENIQKIVRCPETEKVYHVDFSPDGKYIAFSFGPFSGGQQVGGMADGWNICVTDLSGKWVKITTDGNSNKEPDWVPIPDESGHNQKQDANDLIAKI
jgi:Tol biopolymer transport system component